MQDKIYCPKCQKYVPYHIRGIIKKGNIEGYSYNYLGKVSVCDECKNTPYTNNNIRENINESYKAYYRKLREEEKKKEKKKKNRKKRIELIVKVISSVALLSTIITVVRRKNK